MGPLNPRRNKAALIDVLFALALMVVPLSLVGILPDWMSGRASVLGIVVGLIYMVFRDAVNGQSLGRRVFKIQVVHKADRRPIGMGFALLRGILTGLPILGWIDFALTTFTPDSQRYTDKLIGTELISTV